MHQNNSQLSELELVSLAKTGHQEAYTLLIERYEPEIRKIAYKYFLQRAEYDDLIQEGRIAIYRAIQSFDTASGHPFDHFVRMCIKRGLIDTLRSHNRRKHVNLNTAFSLNNNLSDENEHTYLDRMATGTDPAQTVIDLQEARSIIKDLTQNLSAMERQVFAYHFVAGYKPHEMAKTLGLKPKALDNAIQRIKKKTETFRELHNRIC
ncbi:MAG: sigma-70 family RNA polymerase sigma factor [Peptococcaceae bacterium]|nr:sigma-70 family RNA polymerase sigma factor [Peptococcaceae bacterium]